VHKVLFYPVGNGDTSQIILNNGRRILLDFHHLASSEAGVGPEIDLKATLKAELKAANRTSFDVVALTHGDADHIGGSTEFFELLHAKKYQGAGRIKIDELWVPAAMILEETTADGRGDEVIIWRQEARYRLREGKGIRVFSKAEKLKDWLKQEGLTLESRRSMITDAGQVVPGFELSKDGVEFFCHSPFIKHVDGSEDVLRNSCALIFNVRFQAGKNTFDFLAVGDSEWEVLEEIVSTTRAHHNEERLKWDLYNVPHHCSYLALSDVKGATVTAPKAGVKYLLQQGREGAYLVSSSNPIPDTKESRAQVQPPHVQARACYEQYLDEISGSDFLVTMEESNAKSPQAIAFKISETGITRERKIESAAATITSTYIPRAG
jgi:hypothetical protein